MAAAMDIPLSSSSEADFSRWVKDSLINKIVQKILNDLMTYTKPPDTFIVDINPIEFPPPMMKEIDEEIVQRFSPRGWRVKYNFYVLHTKYPQYGLMDKTMSYFSVHNVHMVS